jgi:hypothetical protein
LEGQEDQTNTLNSEGNKLQLSTPKQSEISDLEKQEIGSRLKKIS